jgi:Glycosyl transferases group 1
MKGLLYYRTHLDDLQNAGIVRKCQHFAAALAAHDIATDSVFYSEKGLVNKDGVVLKQPVSGFTSSFSKGRLSHIYLFYFLSDKYLKTKINWQDYDFIIIRHLPMHYNFIEFLSYLKSNYPHLTIIIDFPTFPYEAELMRGLQGHILAYIDAFYHKILAKYVDFALYNGNIEHIFSIPVVKVANGIGLEGLIVNREVPPFLDTLEVVFAGNISEWHGIDRALFGMKNSKKSNVHLTIIGEGAALPDLKEMVKNLQIADKVTFVAPQNREKLQKYYEKAHLGLGSLALHRIGLQEATPLKHREYCAVGLPFVYTGIDDDFGEKFEFALQLNADETPLDWDLIVNFYLNLLSKQVDLPLVMRKYAKENLIWERKVAELVSKLANKL